MPLTNCKIHLELNWAIDYLMYNVEVDTEFNITDKNSYFVN